MPLASQTATPNLLLRALAAEDFALLQPHLERVELPLREVLYVPNEAIERVYFPEGGVASIVVEEEGGGMIEAGLFGLDGMSGSAVVLGSGQSPHHSMIQVDGGPAMVIGSDKLMDACRGSHELHLVLLRFAHTLSIQAAATAAANANYELPERLARWLLMCHDRSDGDRMRLTHEFMGMMLAVRRSGVTVTLHALEATGAIRSTRGTVSVLDRDRLAEIAGESYGVPENEYRRLIAKFGKNAEQ